MLKISDERFNFSFLDDSLDNIDFNNCENIFKEIYKEDVNSKYEHQDYLDELPLKPGDYITGLYSTTSKDTLLLFTNLGHYLYVPIHEIQDTKWKELGKHISNIIDLGY